MQDIVYKRSSPHISPPESDTVLIAPTPVVVQRIEQVLSLATGMVARLQRLAAPESRRFTIKQAARNPQLPVSRPAPQLPSLPKLLKLNTGPLTQQLRTPLGKFTVIQGVALAALIVIVGTASAQKNHQTALSSTQASPTTTYRQYLPTGGSNLAVVAAGVTQLADVKSSLAQEVWATPWNITSLPASGKNFRSVSAFWGTVGSDSVSIQSKAAWTGWDTYVASQPTGHPTYYLTVSGNPNLTSVMLTDPVKRSQHITNLLTAVQQHGFDGIDIDYEGLGRENREIFTTFSQALTAQFHAAHKQVAITVEARLNNDVPMDWYKLGQSADELRVMAYDYHGQTTDVPGPIAPIGWLQQIMQYAQSNVSPNKLVIGLGDYGYDWQAGSNGAWNGAGITRDQAMALASSYHQTIVHQTGIDPRGYDVGSVPEFTYTDSNGHQHDVWYEDADSLQAKETLVSQYHPAGIIFWTVGLTQPS